jgi:endonuclease YncB( thermonuclease family)
MLNKIKNIFINNNISNNIDKMDKNIDNMDKINDSIDYSKAVKFIPPITNGFVIKVYDGDTITIASHLPYDKSPLYKFSVRLNNIDCPELRSSNTNEKECAKIAKDELTKLILYKFIRLENIGTEKYGRILADVYIDDIHINEYMVNKRLAIYYNGGTKKTPNDWMEYYKNGVFDT